MACLGGPHSTFDSAGRLVSASFAIPAFTSFSPSRFASSMSAGSSANRPTSIAFTTQKLVSAGQGRAAASSSTRSEAGDESIAIKTFKGNTSYGYSVFGELPDVRLQSSGCSRQKQTAVTKITRNRADHHRKVLLRTPYSARERWNDERPS
jgi:hypothetical protein